MLLRNGKHAAQRTKSPPGDHPPATTSTTSIPRSAPAATCSICWLTKWSALAIGAPRRSPAASASCNGSFRTSAPRSSLRPCADSRTMDSSAAPSIPPYRYTWSTRSPVSAAASPSPCRRCARLGRDQPRRHPGTVVPTTAQAGCSACTRQRDATSATIRSDNSRSARLASASCAIRFICPGRGRRPGRLTSQAPVSASASGDYAR